jgi:hypothetical protein
MANESGMNNEGNALVRAFRNRALLRQAREQNAAKNDIKIGTEAPTGHPEGAIVGESWQERNAREAREARKKLTEYTG